MIEFEISAWFIHALLIAIAASASLNIAPFLPGIRDISPNRIERRWVGYLVTSLALALWIILNPQESAIHAGLSWATILLWLLIPNTIINLYHRSNTLALINDALKSDVPLTRRQQALLENAIARNLDLLQSAEVQLLMLQALLDPRYRRDPDDPSQWKKPKEDID